MHEELIIAGFGGQGVLTIGKLLSEAGMREGRNVSWLPSYGPEMRGGTANVHVIISDEPVGSPIIVEATIVVAMNKPSLTKFESYLIKDGYLFINSSIIDIEPRRSDVKIVKVPANEIANEIGDLKVANMVMTGAIIKATNCVKYETFEKVIRDTMTGKKEKYLPLNLEAIKRGYEYIKS